MVTAGILPFRENSHSGTGSRTRDLMISRQRLWPPDYEADRTYSSMLADFLLVSNINQCYFLDEWTVADALVRY